MDARFKAPPSPYDWTITIGLEGKVEPIFPGSKDFAIRPNPLFDIRRYGTPERFRGPRDGIGFGLIEGSNFQIGPVGALRIPRRESDDPAALHGLGNVPWAVELGGFAEYWFVSDKGQFAQVGYEVTPEVLERTGTTLATMVEGIEAGVFPSHPTSVSTNPWVECEYCDPDGLGVIELRRAWERKRLDPALAPYADLAEPLDAGEAAEALTLVEVDAGGFDG